MTFYIFNRENIESLKQIHQYRDRPVVYNSRLLRRSFYSINYDDDLKTAIYLHYMVLPSGIQLNLQSLPDAPKITQATKLLNDNPDISQIVTYDTEHPHKYLLVCYNNNQIDLIYHCFYDLYIKDVMAKLTEIGVNCSFNNYQLLIPNINDPEIYIVVTYILQTIPDYNNFNETKYVRNYINIFRKFPKWSMNAFNFSEYDAIFDQLITEPDMYDIVIELTQSYLEFYADNETSKKKAYFNMGFILSNHDDPEMRDLAIDYLYKAGDLSEAKRLRTRLFAEKLKKPFDDTSDVDKEIELWLNK